MPSILTFGVCIRNPDRWASKAFFWEHLELTFLLSGSILEQSILGLISLFAC
jgi:uncharacterized membrane protein